MKLREYFLFTKKIKILLNNSSPSSNSLPTLLWRVVLSIKVNIFVFFATSILETSYNYGWTADVTQAVLMMSLLCFYACLWKVRKLSDFISNIFMCVQKMDEGLTGLEWHEGELLMTEL